MTSRFVCRLFMWGRGFLFFRDVFFFFLCFFLFFQAEDGIRDLVRSRGLGDVYKRQVLIGVGITGALVVIVLAVGLLQQLVLIPNSPVATVNGDTITTCLLYTSDAADERSSVDLGGRRIIKKKN